MGLAAAMGGWSARHRWAAVGGWLLFVIVAMVIGQAAGRVDVNEDKSMPGEVAQAATIIDDAGLQSPAGEMVLIQTSARHRHRPGRARRGARRDGRGVRPPAR